MRRIGDTGNKGILVGRIRPRRACGENGHSVRSSRAQWSATPRSAQTARASLVRRPLAPAQLLRIRFNPRNPRLLASSRVRSITAIAVVAEIAMLRH
jgi:hypothetical protein